MAKALLPQLEAKGSVTRRHLGVSIQPITPELAKSMKLKDAKGALVADLTKGSPAEAAGIHRGDVFVSFDGKTVAASTVTPTRPRPPGGSRCTNPAVPDS